MENPLIWLAAVAGMVGADSFAWTQASWAVEELRKTSDWWGLYKRGWRPRALIPRYSSFGIVLLLAFASHRAPNHTGAFVIACGFALLIYFAVFAYVFSRELAEHRASEAPGGS